MQKVQNFLIHSMFGLIYIYSLRGAYTMEQYLIDLIERMSEKTVIKPGVIFDSSRDSVSWIAYREAEKLRDEKYIIQLTDYIVDEERIMFRKSAYFILGNLLTKFKSLEAIQFYVDRLLVETNTMILDSMLCSLYLIRKGPTIDISPIIKCTENINKMIRSSAIRALATTSHESAKEKIRTIVQLKDHKKYKYEIIYAIQTLSTIGDINDIDFIKPLYSSCVRDIQVSAKYAVESLEYSYT